MDELLVYIAWLNRIKLALVHWKYTVIHFIKFHLFTKTIAYSEEMNIRKIFVGLVSSCWLLVIVGN